MKGPQSRALPEARQERRSLTTAGVRGEGGYATRPEGAVGGVTVSSLPFCRIQVVVLKVTMQ